MVDWKMGGGSQILELDIIAECKLGYIANW